MCKASILTVLCLLAACADDDAGRVTAPFDASGKLAPDAGARPASSLRPALPRPPTYGLPAELRPPR